MRWAISAGDSSATVSLSRRFSPANVGEAQEVSIKGGAIWAPRFDKPLKLVRAPPDVRPADERTHERRPLPGVVTVDLGDGGTETLPQLRFQRMEELPLALQVV